MKEVNALLIEIQCAVGCLGCVIHALWLVHNNNGICVLYVPHGSFAAQLVLCLVDDILRFFKGVDVDNHNLNGGAGCKLAHIGELCRIVNEKAAGHIVVLVAKVFSGNFKGFIHALTNRHGRNNNNKLGKAVALVQLKDAFRVDISLAGTCFHLNAKLIFVVRQGFRPGATHFFAAVYG